MNNKNCETHKKETSKKNIKEEVKNKKDKNNKKKEKKIKQDTTEDFDIIQLKEQLLKYKKKEREIILRAKAEIENNKRRTEKEIEKAHKFALEKFINEILPVIDNLERTINLFNTKKVKIQSILEGIKLTFKSFITIINKYGVKIIKETNITFNPEIHQAVKIIETKEIEENKIINIIQNGYILNERLLRPAMVIVSKKTNDKIIE